MFEFQVTFEGKEYDFVFSIELDDTGGKLKLPYNRSEDAWMAAQKFIHKHELPQGYLDTIANFIIKNSGGVGGGGSASNGGGGGGHDPFTGQLKNDEGSHVMDIYFEFAGSGAYSSNGDTGTNNRGASSSAAANSAPMEVDNSYFPQKDFLSFTQVPKLEAMTAKLKEFNGQVKEEQRLQDGQLDRLKLLCQRGESYIHAVLSVPRSPSHCGSNVEALYSNNLSFVSRLPGVHCRRRGQPAQVPRMAVREDLPSP